MPLLPFIRRHRDSLRGYLIAGLTLGASFALAEYFARADSSYPQRFWPLMIRGIAAGSLILTAIGVFELSSRNRLAKHRFGFLVLVRLAVYFLIISFWLSIINGIWLIIDRDVPFQTGLFNYITGFSYAVNLLTILPALAVMLALQEINSLHRKGELWQFVLGKYHRPREIERIFCFIDLNDSTAIAERLGHLQFGLFLKDYYADISEAIRQTRAEIYQYVGDEIILSWPIRAGVRENNALRCFFLMQAAIGARRKQYLEKYGCYPRFKAGLHAGPVVVLWVGEVKKEIMYLGDVMNTAARIREACKRLSSDFLVSQDVLDRLDDFNAFDISFLEETTPRGKERSVRLYGVKLLDNATPQT